eukprot:787969-Amorphochlora_amoeboformis.AAC.1
MIPAENVLFRCYRITFPGPWQGLSGIMWQSGYLQRHLKGRRECSVGWIGWVRCVMLVQDG